MVLALLTLLIAAANAGGISVSPAWLNVDVRPQQNNEFAITVRNRSGLERAFEVVVDDMWYDPASNATQFPPGGTTERSLAPYLEVFPPRLLVRPEAAAEFTISVSTEALDHGGYYASLRVTSIPRNEDRTGMVANNRMQFIVPLFVGVNGNQSPGAEIEEATLTATDGSVPHPYTLDLLVHNSGDTHIRPRAQGVVRSTDGTSVTATFDEQSPIFILPGQDARLSVPLTPGSLEGEYSVIGALRFGEQGAAAFALPLSIAAPPSAPGPEDETAP